ncbi:MAG: DUF5615 family PIN-like protein [Dehalococcoidia bacterium]
MPRGIYTDNDSGDDVVVHWLRAHGYDVTTSVEAGRTRAPDSEQLRYATAHGWVIYTPNVADYARLHSEWMLSGESHAGILARVYQQLDVGEQIRRLDRALRENEGLDMTNVFSYL